MNEGRENRDGVRGAGRPVLATGRLALRELVEGDLDAVAAILGDAEVMRFWPAPFDRATSAEWIAVQRERYAREGYGYWMASERGSGRPVGQVGLLRQDVEGVARCGLGYIIDRPFWRRGYATELAAACCDYAEGTLGIRDVVALIRPENTPSRGVAEKIGMVAGRAVKYHGFAHIVYGREA